MDAALRVSFHYLASRPTDDFQELLLREVVDATRAPPTAFVCEACGGEGPKHRCWDCFWPPLLCNSCIVECHTGQPLHRIEVFVSYFLKMVAYALDPDVEWCGLGYRQFAGTRPPHSPWPWPGGTMSQSNLQCSLYHREHPGNS